MLLNSLFFIENQRTEANSISASLRIDSAHQIFHGHFPGHPVVPGVCMVQLVRELIEQTIGTQLNLKSAGNIKFLSLINPIQNGHINATITYVQQPGQYLINATLFDGNTTFFKLSKAILQHK